MSKGDMLERRLQREITARKQAEVLLEDKARELFETNIQLRKANEELLRFNQNLEEEIQARSKALLRSEIKYKKIIEGMALGLLEVNNDEIIVRAYDSFCHMTGYTEDELLGKEASQLLLPPAYQKFMQQQTNERLLGHSSVYEVELIKKDGSHIWVLVSGTPIQDINGNIVGSMGIHYDITYQKELQRKLEKAKLVAEAAQEAEKQFLANMSHEIRTPLNAIIGMAHLLLDTPLDTEQKDFLNVLKSSANILQGLISDILDFSKIESGKLEMSMREFDIHALVRSLQKTFELKLETKPVQLHTYVDSSIQTMLRGDDLLLNQILINLLGNAEKFTSSGEIQLTIGTQNRINNEIVLLISVQDSGIGMSKDEIEHIFKHYQQAKSDTRIKYGGTGLGLTITKRLVDLKGGDIQVESTPGKGTTFSISLPYEITNNPIQDILEASGDTLLHRSPESHLLIVEDNSMNRKYISTLLKKWNINFDMAIDGYKALEFVQSKKYDLIFMDIQMPGIDGYETTIQIRNTHNLNQKTPICALTASAIQQDKEKAIKVGMTDFLAKPFTPKQLTKQINRYINNDTMNAEGGIAKAPLNNATNMDLTMDTAYLNELYGGDLEYASDMFQTFLDYSLPDAEALETRLKEGEHDAIRKAAHKLKPSLGMVGYPQLSAILQDIETMAGKQEPLDAIKKKHQQFKVALQEIIPVLRNELKLMQQGQTNIFE